MVFGVFGSISNYKVFDAVIKFITIDVVDYLRRFKLTFKMLLHNKPLFRNETAFKVKDSVAIGDSSFTIKSSSKYGVSILSKPYIMVKAITLSVMNVLASYFYTFHISILRLTSSIVNKRGGQFIWTQANEF